MQAYIKYQHTENSRGYCEAYKLLNEDITREHSSFNFLNCGSNCLQSRFQDLFHQHKTKEKHDNFILVHLRIQIRSMM